MQVPFPLCCDCSGPYTARYARCVVHGGCVVWHGAWCTYVCVRAYVHVCDGVIQYAVQYAMCSA